MELDWRQYITENRYCLPFIDASEWSTFNHDIKGCAWNGLQCQKANRPDGMNLGVEHSICGHLALADWWKWETMFVAHANNPTALTWKQENEVLNCSMMYAWLLFCSDCRILYLLIKGQCLNGWLWLTWPFLDLDLILLTFHWPWFILTMTSVMSEIVARVMSYTLYFEVSHARHRPCWHCVGAYDALSAMVSTGCCACRLRWPQGQLELQPRTCWSGVRRWQRTTRVYASLTWPPASAMAWLSVPSSMSTDQTLCK